MRAHAIFLCVLLCLGGHCLLIASADRIAYADVSKSDDGSDSSNLASDSNASGSRDAVSVYNVRRVAVCFFGLTRSLSYTIDNLRRNILDAIENQGAVYDIYLHTYNASHVQNPRAAEQDVPVDHTLFRLLHPVTFEVEDNVAFVSNVVRPMMQQLLQRGDPWREKEPHVSLTNLVAALHSLKRVTELMDASGEQYDAVLYTRTDLHFFQPLDLKALWLPGTPAETLFMPSFHQFKGYNDRFAIGHPAAARVYGTRYDQILSYVAKKPLHAERFCKHVLSRVHVENMRPCFLFSRIRATGQLWETPHTSGKCDVVGRHKSGQLLLQLDKMSFWQVREVTPEGSKDAAAQQNKRRIAGKKSGRGVR